MSNDIWLSVVDASNLLEVSDRTIRRNINRYATKEIKTIGGKQYRILLNSLGDAAVSKYYGSFLLGQPINKSIKELEKIIAISEKEIEGRTKLICEAKKRIAELKEMVRSNSNE